MQSSSLPPSGSPDGLGFRQRRFSALQAPSSASSGVSGPVAAQPASITSPWRRGFARAVAERPAIVVPSSLRQAETSDQSDDWREARLTELSRLEDMGTWQLVVPPSGANILGSKWVFALKTKPDGTIDRFKARLVCQGFGQKEGVDFDETFASTAGRATVRLFLALVCVLGLKVKQVDVTTAFLYGQADKEIFMRQPPGHDDGSGRVCRLIRALYGLKQAPRIWSETLRASLIRMGFRPSDMDPCLYLLRKDGQDLFLLDFVDDMLLASHSDSLIDWVFAELCKEYAITDMGDVERYVGLYVHHDRASGQMWVHQAPYLTELAEKFGVSGRAHPDTPLPSDFVLAHPWEVSGEDPPESHHGRSDGLLPPDGVKRFQQIVGSLNYVAHSVRPDVAFAVNLLSRCTHCPRVRHMSAAERCVSYLAGSSDLGLRFTRRSGMLLECFVDASYPSFGDKKSMTGFLLMFAGAPIAWTARKQDRVTTSTCDAESHAIVASVQHAEYLRDFLEELGFTQFLPTPVYNDNTAAVSLCIDPLAHKKSVQMTRQMAYIRERTRYGVIQPSHVRTQDQPADFLTKALDGPAFQRCCELAGLARVPALSSAPS